jgi:hypothetical protein
MRMRFIPAILILVVLPLYAAAQSPAAKSACDRACLQKFVDQYVDAMAANDPSKAPFAKNVKYTENGVRLQPGEGLWASAVGKGNYKFYVPDVEIQSIAYIGTMREANEKNPKAVLVPIALRLKIQNGQITEAEQLTIRAEFGGVAAGDAVEKAGKPHPVYAEIIPPAERPSREELIKLANMYFSGMQKNDGKGVYPFADDCNRLENGMQSTNAPLKPGEKKPDPKTSISYSPSWGCKEQFESGLLHFVTRIRDRRYVAVDRDRGIVFAFGFFDHAAGKTRTFQVPDGRTVTAGPMSPWTWQIAELFKIEKGKIRKIEAVLQQVPYGMNSGWSTYEQGMSDQIQIVK